MEIARIDWRKEIAKRTPNEAKEWQIKEYRRCAEDKVYWYNNYVWTIDTRRTPSIIPFVLHDYQIDLVKQLEDLGRDDLQEIIDEAKAGEFHDFANKKYATPKVVLYKKLKDKGLNSIAEDVKNGVYDEPAGRK